jgi:hypothetical protein
MIQQLGFLTSIVTFNFVKTLWDPFIKALHTLHVRKYSKKIRRPPIHSHSRIDMN